MCCIKRFRLLSLSILVLPLLFSCLKDQKDAQDPFIVDDSDVVGEYEVPDDAGIIGEEDSRYEGDMIDESALQSESNDMMDIFEGTASEEGTEPVGELDDLESLNSGT